MTTKPLNELISEQGSGLIGQIDHINYVVQEANAQDFIATWNKLGFHESTRIESQKYNVTHVALTSGSEGMLPWGAMTGLTFSSDPSSPALEFIQRHGPGVQYFAYSVAPDADMDELYDAMKAWGWKLMGPVLTYTSEAGGPRLRLIAVAPSVAWGPFVLFIQRMPDENGTSHADYDILLWDTLYDYYADFSRELAEDEEDDE